MNVLVPFETESTNSLTEKLRGISLLNNKSGSEKIDDQHELLSLVTRRTNNHVIITDKSGLIEWVNESFEKFTGFLLLGLAIINGILKRWNGRIWVESEVGKGSSFFFTMPYLPQKQQNFSMTVAEDLYFADVKV